MRMAFARSYTTGIRPASMSLVRLFSTPILAGRGNLSRFRRHGPSGVPALRALLPAPPLPFLRGGGVPPLLPKKPTSPKNHNFSETSQLSPKNCAPVSYRADGRRAGTAHDARDEGKNRQDEPKNRQDTRGN